MPAMAWTSLQIGRAVGERRGCHLDGVGGMPPQAGLSDTDVRDVIGYIRAQ